MARLTTTLIGAALFLYGLLAAFSPLPLGAPLVIIGLFMIAGANPAMRPVIRSMRARWPWFDRLVRIVAPRTRGAVHDVIEETDPDGHNGGRAKRETAPRGKDP